MSTFNHTESLNWLNAQIGQHLDYDQKYGQQCVDFFNFYYKTVTGDNPYTVGYGVNGAKDLWNVPNGNLTKIPDSSTLKPQPGDIAVYGSGWGGGYGHVEIVIETDTTGCTFLGENEHNNPNEGVTRVHRTWAQMRGLIGVMRFNWVVAQPYVITGITPKELRVRPNHYRWNLAQPTFDAIIANPITSSGPEGVVFTAVALLTRPDLPNYSWYLDDANAPHGWNSLDCEEVIVQPMPTPYVPPAAPVVTKAAETYVLLTSLPAYASTDDLVKGKNPTPLPAGIYYVWEKGGTNGIYYRLSHDNIHEENLWVNTVSNKKPLNPPIPKPSERDDTWKAERKFFYQDRNRYDEYELQTDVVVKDLDNKGKSFFISAYKPNSSDNAVLKVYGTVFKKGIKYYILHDPNDVNWEYWYAIPMLNPHTGKPYLLKYSDTYDTTPVKHELTVSEMALEAFARLGYRVMDVVRSLKVRK